MASHDTPPRPGSFHVRLVIAICASTLLAGNPVRAQGTACDPANSTVPPELVGDPTVDCNRNAILDPCDIELGTSADLDLDGIPDECPVLPPHCVLPVEVRGDPGIDCNSNGILDRCDIELGTSADLDLDGIPDECSVPPPDCALPAESVGDPKTDCNANGILDRCDLERGTSVDANRDGRPDECPEIVDDPVRVFADALGSATELSSVGLVPPKTLDFLLQNRAALEADSRSLVDALAVKDFTTTPPDDLPVEMGNGAAGGIIRGGFVFAISAQGIFVGAFSSQAVWDDAADPCRRQITGHTFYGGVINGVCNSLQVGSTYSETCPATPDCPAPAVDCAALQVRCRQIFGATLSSFSTPLATLCAPCEPATQLPGDCNSDGRVELSDAVCLLGHLFLASPSRLTCGTGTTRDPSNLALLDWNGDGRIDLADPISTLMWLFGSGGGAPGSPHVLGTACAAIPGCPVDCGG